MNVQILPEVLRRLLLSDGTIPVDAAALKEAMLDHAVAKQQEEQC